MKKAKNQKAALALELARAQNEMRSKMRQVIQTKISALDPDLSFELLEVIGLLWRSDGINQQEISDRLSKDKSSVTYLINALVKRALVKRIEHEKDRRHKLIFLTDKGKQIRKVIYPLVLESYADACGDIDLEILKQNTVMIREMTKNLDAFGD
ncbi:hypothetical protein GCM10027566_01960 [Arachidicoccus ginsenosidivorans]|uniref:MarR family transcriptional regulator n=1 Tax=Arachidicoccus ginsenosidivorans TaxID=496057 RepID=A0A5B8VQW7_9BACT|nr:MarR family transcriptional regulator [Arachidicoccus ginsenosidivorans]QEC72658.1 MarR family transcriptional regulator [Arachidicoccus ginsenosidivorans]